MKDVPVEKTRSWLKSVFNINREIDFERESAEFSLKRVKELEKEKEEIYKVIFLLENPTHKAILHKRYVQGKKWEDISEEMYYELAQIHRLHNEAISEVHTLRNKMILNDTTNV